MPVPPRSLALLAVVLAAAPSLPGAAEDAPAGDAATAKSSPEHLPNLGFRIYEGEHGQLYVRLFTYVRYLNQMGLDPSYADSFGNERSLQRRQDVQLNKLLIPFSGWFLSPKFRYFLYVWSSNPSQGDPAQVVGAGNLTYVFGPHLALGGGIASLPCVRSTEGQYPYWLSVDERLTADEFFRGSYTTGVWLKGELVEGLKYQAMLGNNLSQLGVSAAQLDNTLDTTSLMLAWLPTTGEYGAWDGFGDYDFHERVATRLGAHFTRSREDKQTQPSTNGIENSQIRLSDGNVVFTPDLFGPGVTVNRVTYRMASVDAGIKYRGFSVEAEHYWRWLSDFSGTDTAGIEDVHDTGFQVQTSAMVVRAVLQAYLGGSMIFGAYGDARELRAGLNWFPFASRGVRINAEWIRLAHCPVGYSAVPYPVGGNGDVFHLNTEMNF